MSVKNPAAGVSPLQHTCADTGDFDALRQIIETNYNTQRAKGKNIFTVDVPPDELYRAYLKGFGTAELVQHHSCTACAHFIRHYGALVTISTDGSRGVITPLMWPQSQTHIEKLYRQPIKNMYTLVKNAKVNGVFYSELPQWGIPKSKDSVRHVTWSHFSVKNHAVWKNLLKTANQGMAARRENYADIIRAFADPNFAPNHLATALQLLEADALYREERHIGPARWLKSLQDARSQLREPYKSAYTWAMIADAPEGFLHPRSGMLGTLVEGIAQGKSFDTIKAEFASKMDPTKYQRPQVAPGAGNVKRAEEIVQKLGIHNSLKRRPATFRDMSTVWIPTLDTVDPHVGQKPVTIGGVFGHVPTKTVAHDAPARKRMKLPSQTMTWAKFKQTVLPSAEQIDVWLANSGNPIAGFLTAQDPSAPPILAWDYEDARNPTSWYIYTNGSAPRDWHVSYGWNRCIGIALHPALWNESRPLPHQGSGGAFLIQGAYDARNPGACLFPETLISELREVRSTIESFSAATPLPNAKQGAVAGLVFGQSMPARIMVKTATTEGEIIIDRWE